MAQPQFRGLHLNQLEVAGDVAANWGRRGRLRFRNLLDVFLQDPEWSSILLSHPGIDDGNDDDWIPQRGLGAGSYGKVALFSRKDQLGDVIDNMAIKQRSLVHDFQVADGIWTINLAKEAFLQSQLTTQDRDDCVVPLRNYKRYTRQISCRLYMDFAEHGSLETIRLRYDAWDKFMPELFLWCVFKKLAKAAVLLESCPRTWQPMSTTAKDQRRNERFILHLDIKPANIMVFGKEAFKKAPRRLPEMPVVKLGDFGISQVTSSQNVSAPLARNPDRLQNGTWAYKPPEAPSDDQFDNGWLTNISLFDLMTLTLPEWCRSEIEKLEENKYWDANDASYEHFMPRSVLEIPAANYSRALRDLVYQCLRPKPVSRPSSTELLVSAKAGKKACKTRIRQERSGRGVRNPNEVLLDTKEFNELAYAPERAFVGEPNQENEVDWSDWCDMRNVAMQDPNQPQLELPRPKYDDFYEKEVEVNSRKRKPADLRGEHWKAAGNAVIMRPNEDEMAVNEAQRAKRPRRMESWDSDTETDDRHKAKLRDLRTRCGYADRIPVRMFEFVLQAEKRVVDQAEVVMKWLCEPGAPDLQEPWLQEEDVAPKANRVRERLGAMTTELRARGIRKTWKLRECRYFVANSEFGVEQVDHAVEQMLAVFT